MYLRTLRLSRAALLAKLEKEDDLVEIAFTQGELKQLRIVELLPAEIERLDKLLMEGEEFHAMKEKNG